MISAQVVEPDAGVWHILRKNLERNSCGAWHVGGVVGSKAMKTVGPGSHRRDTIL